MRLVLYQPDIPQNTGTILRMAACLGVPVDIVGPAGFDLSGKALKRAGLDYLGHADLTKHISFEVFEQVRCGRAGRLILATTKAIARYTDFTFEAHDHLLLGRESAGVPDNVREAADQCITIPMKHSLRSINVAIAAAMIMGEALRQTNGFPDESSP